MTRDDCCECGEDVHINESFQLKVFKYGEIWWCFKCANNQLKIVDKVIIGVEQFEGL